MAFRERTNSTGKSIINWFKDSFGGKDERQKKKVDFPRRATSTPHKQASLFANVLHELQDLDISEIAVQHIDFAALGAFGEEGHFDHPDFDNDITAYSFQTEALPPNTLTEWEIHGGDAAYKRLALFIYDLYLDRPMPREVLHLAIHYVQCCIKSMDILRNDLEDLGVAAVGLAAKVERQRGFNLAFLEDYNLKNIFIMEKKICQALNFALWPTTIPFFMRLLNATTCAKNWQWECAKCFSDLLICERELVEISPSLAAGVVMRLVAKIDGGESWTDNCYAIIQKPKEEYDRPHALLCRLILMVLDSPRSFEPLSSKHEKAFRFILRYKGFLRNEFDYAQFNFIV